MAVDSWRQGLDTWPKFVPPLELDPKKTGLMIIDMQHSDGHRDYGLGKILRDHNVQMWEYYFGRVERVVLPNTLRLLQFFRQNGLRVVFVSLGSEMPDYSDLSSWRKSREDNLQSSGKRVSFYKKAFEYSFLPGLEPREGELTVHKTTASVFNSTMLDQKLRNMGLEGLLVVGVVTNGCVWSSAQGASDRGFKTVIVDDASATLDEDSHNSTLRSFARLHGYVRSTDEMLVDLGMKMEAYRAHAAVRST